MVSGQWSCMTIDPLPLTTMVVSVFEKVVVVMVVMLAVAKYAVQHILYSIDRGGGQGCVLIVVVGLHHRICYCSG